MLARMIGAPEPRCEQPAASIPSLGKRCSNRRLREELQVELHYPTIESGLPAALTPPAPA
jgi:hypothetical protein